MGETASRIAVANHRYRIFDVNQWVRDASGRNPRVAIEPRKPGKCGGTKALLLRMRMRRLYVTLRLMPEGFHAGK
jgi:hypothetical protein